MELLQDRSQSEVLPKGVNDDPEVLGSLMNRLVACGAIPYFIFAGWTKERRYCGWNCCGLTNIQIRRKIFA